MDPVTAEPFYVQSDTGKIHLRYRIKGRTVDDGRCGIDDNWKPIDEQALSDVEPGAYCEFCFPWR